MGHKRSDDYTKGYRVARGLHTARGVTAYDMRRRRDSDIVSDCGPEFAEGFASYVNNNC